MADLMSGGSGAPGTSNGRGPVAVPRPAAAPMPTSSPSGIRGPRMIMQERAAREARQRAEAEQLQMARNRAEQEARLVDEARRRNEERQRRSAGVAGGQPADPQSFDGHGQVPQESSQGPRASATNTHNQPQPQQSQQQRTSHNVANQQVPPTYNAANAAQPQQQSQQQQSQRPTSDNAAQSLEPTRPRNSFPHAFERWETLSAHWEGLTSYWIRKLEQNKDDINRDPISQQLARQVTDLSAAGANLFHAVVELQRLRASSERKFQRWFFETRSELERAQEVNAILESALEKERRGRADAIRDAVDHERGTSKAQKQLSEMRKELAISKEEARRAWEELGRREQEERDRTLSLQSGHPTIVGGVQVVPMTQGGPSRHTSTRDQAAYQGEYTQGYAAEHSHVPSSQPSPPTATSSAGYYGAQEPTSQPPPQQHQQQHQHQQQQQQQQHQHQSRRQGGSEGGYSEGEYVLDANGNFLLDVHGNRIPFAVPPSTYSGSDPDAEYDTPATTNPPSGGYEPQSTSSVGGAAAAAPVPKPAGESSKQGDPKGNAQDYSGQEYGAPDWETVPRHHHPTRLSDVIEEEDERSRTSASQLSRG